MDVIEVTGAAVEADYLCNGDISTTIRGTAGTRPGSVLSTNRDLSQLVPGQ
jgi:hypothetical protein